MCPERLYLLNYSSILQVREPRGEAQKKPDIRRATAATEIVKNYVIGDSNVRISRLSSNPSRQRATQSRSAPRE